MQLPFKTILALFGSFSLFINPRLVVRIRFDLQWVEIEQTLQLLPFSRPIRFRGPPELRADTLQAWQGPAGAASVRLLVGT